jgi:thioesterase domain-containing protein
VGDVVQWQLKQIWESVLRTPNIGAGDDFFDLGGHSLAAAEVCSLIERVMGVRLPLMALAEAPTIGTLSRALRDHGWREAWSPAVVLQRGASRPPLFCMAGAGSDVFALRELARCLDPDQPVYGLQPRGLDGVTPFHQTVEEAASWCLTAIRRIQPAGPYNLCGSSFGGKVVFEIARQLQDAGEPIGLLALLDTAAPGHPRRVPHPTPRARLVAATRPFLPPNLFVLAADLYLRHELTPHWTRELRRMTRRYWRAWLHVAMPVRHRRPFDLRFECLQVASFKASRRYSPRPIDARIDVFPSAPSPAPGLLADNPSLGWERLAFGGVRVHPISGRHADQLRDPAVRQIAAVLDDRLARR